MRTAAVAFLLSLVTGALLTPLIRRAALRVGAVDHALSSRKVHKQPIPRLGGIAIVAAFFAPFVALLFTSSGVGEVFRSEPRTAIALFAGGAVVAALGIWDDLKGTRARTKFAVQFAVAALVYCLGYRIDAISNPFGAPIALGWLGLPFTLLWITGVINAINLIDGLDGLAGGVALISVGVTFVAAAWYGEPLMVLVTAALAGAILGFLRYNFNPASIFMGDTGSMFLGFVLSTSAIHTHQKSSAAVAILVPIVALALPIIDTLLALVRRAARGVPLFSPDREHIHHRLLARGLSHRNTVLVLYGASAVLGIFALALASATGPFAAIVLGTLGFGGAVMLRLLGYVQFGKAAAVLELRRKNLEMRRSVREVGDELRRAVCPEDLWSAVRSALPVLGAECVALQFELHGPEGLERREFRDGPEAPNPKVLRTRHSLLGERPDTGTLELGWPEGRAGLDRDTEIAVELLCEHVLEAVDRLDLRAQAPLVVTPIRARALAVNQAAALRQGVAGTRG